MRESSSIRLPEGKSMKDFRIAGLDRLKYLEATIKEKTEERQRFIDFLITVGVSPKEIENLRLSSNGSHRRPTSEATRKKISIAQKKRYAEQRKKDKS